MKYANPALEYLDRTESFDRTICTGPIIDSEILPANGKEFFLINCNAKLVLKDVAINHGILVRDLMERIRNEERHYRYLSYELRREEEVAKCP